MKIGFAKVPNKTEPLSVAETLANPAIMSGIVAGALNRLCSSKSNIEKVPFESEILALPELPPKTIRKEQQGLLRDYRKLLDCAGNRCDPRDIDRCFFDLYDDAVEMCSGIFILIRLYWKRCYSKIN